MELMGVIFQAAWNMQNATKKQEQVVALNF
jgi:hypothetical protein